MELMVIKYPAVFAAIGTALADVAQADREAVLGVFLPTRAAPAHYTRARKYLEAVRDFPHGITTNELAFAVGVTKQAASNFLSAATSRGETVRVRRGVYALAPAA